MRVARVNVAAVALLVMCAQACSFALEEPVAAVTNRCRNDADCAGARCELDMCVAATDGMYPLTIEVTPASARFGAVPPTIALPAFVPGGSHEIPLPAPEPAAVAGNVRAGAVAVAAEIRFVVAASTPTSMQRPIVAMASQESVMTGAGDAVDYNVLLLRETPYRVRVVPTDRAAYPPLRTVLQADSQPSRRFDLAYDDAAFSSVTVNVIGLPDGVWSIVATDPATAEEISTRAILSVDSTVATLTSAESLDAYDLVIAPVAETGVADGRATFRIPSTALSPTNGVAKLQLPVLAAVVSFTGIVDHCRDLASDPPSQVRPALSAALRSRSLLTFDGSTTTSATFTATTTASYDAAMREWNFSAQVPPGQYDVVVTPTAEGECGVFAESRGIQAPSQANATTAALLQLPALSFLSGRVRTAGPMPAGVMGAAVVANGLGLRDAIAFDPNDGTVTRYNRSQQTTTDDLGEFTLPIDVGAYDVIIKPPPESGFAWHVLRDVNVGARTDTPFDREINLSAPIVLRALLQTVDNGDLMAGATVRAFTTTSDAERGERALTLGTAVADADGRFVLLLPAAIDQGWY